MNPPPCFPLIYIIARVLDFVSRQLLFNMTKLNDGCHISPNGSMAEMNCLKPIDLLLSDKLVTVAAPMVRYSK